MELINQTNKTTQHYLEKLVETPCFSSKSRVLSTILFCVLLLLTIVGAIAFIHANHIHLHYCLEDAQDCKSNSPTLTYLVSACHLASGLLKEPWLTQKTLSDSAKEETIRIIEQFLRNYDDKWNDDL